MNPYERKNNMFATVFCSACFGASLVAAIYYFIKGNRPAAFGFLFLFLFNFVFVLTQMF